MLLEVDRELAAAAKAVGCFCGGGLHRGDYERKPRGGADGQGPEHSKRLSFCCGREGCRKRVTPASLRFLERRVYWGVVVVLGSAFEGGVTAGRVRRVRELIGYPIDRRTLERWVEWWRKGLPKSRILKAATGLFWRKVESGRLPVSLLETVTGPDVATRVTRVLELLSGRWMDRVM